MNQTLSQCLGILLALSTAVGCIAYERLVKAYSFGVLIFIALIYYVITLLFCFATNGIQLKKELGDMFTQHPWSVFLYCITFCTTPIWFYITKRQGVMTGSLYEVKYIVILALIYIFFGENKFTINTGIGLCFAFGSIWFISKT